MTWISVPALSVTRAILQKSLTFHEANSVLPFGFLLFCFVFPFVVNEQDGQRERGREQPKQSPHPARSPSPVTSHNPEIRSRALRQRLK